MTALLPADYAPWLAHIKVRVQAARTRAVLAVNAEQVRLYWDIGQAILQNQTKEGWGSQIIRKLADDLRRELPDSKGFSYTNLRYMQRFAAEFPDWAICQQVVGKLPWGHILTLIEQVKLSEARDWYARQAIEHGWSRATLGVQIETRLHERQGKAISNFERTLPAPLSEMVQQATKDPYLFDFLGIGNEAHELDLEHALAAHVTRFLLELGAGFSYVGRQVPLEVADEDFFIDLLFYHLPQAALLRRHRIEVGGLQARVCRQAEFLSVSHRRPDETPGGQSDRRHAAVQDQEQYPGRVRAQGHPETHRHRRISPDRCHTGRPARQLAKHRRARSGLAHSTRGYGG